MKRNLDATTMADHLVRALMKKEFTRVVGFFAKRVADGRGEELAVNAFAKVGSYLKRNPSTKAEHATIILWLATRQVYADYFKSLMRSRERTLIGSVDEKHFASRDNLPDQVADRELIEFLKKDLTTIPNGQELLGRLQGDSWSEIATRLGTSPPTARTRLARALAELTVRMADRRLNDTLLRELSEMHGHTAESALRLWVAGDKPIGIGVKLGIDQTDALRLQKEVAGFFKDRL